MSTPLKPAILGGAPVRTRPFSAWPVFGKAEEQRLVRTLRSGRWGRLQGSETDLFEARFAKMHGCKYGLAMVNGTVTLKIALLAAGVQAEDEVIVPPYTFFSTASAVIEANAVPVFADIQLDTFNLDPKAVEARITPRTRAIIPVHFAGQPADMAALKSIARRHDLIVIEDAAHAHGASYRNRPAGALGDLASFSFQSSKNLTCGEGGILTTNNRKLAETCRSIHNCGRIPGGIWYEHHRISGNYRLGEFQAAVLNAQLDRLEGQTRTRDRNGQYLAAQISHLPGIYPQGRIPDCTRHSYHLFMLRVDPTEFGLHRDLLVQALRAEGVPCSSGYGFSLNRQPMFLNKAFGPFLPNAAARLDYARQAFPNSDLLCAAQAVWLEQSMFLGSQMDMDDVASAFGKIYLNRELLAQKLPIKPRR